MQRKTILKRLKNWVKICSIMWVLWDCEVKMWRPSGLSSSVILSSAFSSLFLPSTWQDFPLHSWLHNLSLCPTLSHSHACVCEHYGTCAHARSPVCLSNLTPGFACEYVICGAFWEDLWSYRSSTIKACQTHKAIFDPLTRHRCIIVADADE